MSFSTIPQPNLALRIPSLMSRPPAYHHGHLNWVIGIVVVTRISNRPPADFAIHCNTLRAAKEQLDVTSHIPCILSFVCNWSIDRAIMAAKTKTKHYYNVDRIFGATLPFHAYFPLRATGLLIGP